MPDQDDDKVENLSTDFSKQKEQITNNLVNEKKKEWNKKIQEKQKAALTALTAYQNEKAALAALYDDAQADIDFIKKNA